MEGDLKRISGYRDLVSIFYRLFTEETNRAVAKANCIVHKANRTVQKNEQDNVCKTRPKRQKKRTVPCNKCATSIYGFLTVVR